MYSNSKAILNSWQNDINKRIKKLNDLPKLNIVQVGNRIESNMYVNNKINKAKELGIETCMFNLDDDITQKELNKLMTLMLNPTILQLPLPDHLNVEEALGYLNHELDVDGFTTVQKGLLINKDKRAFVPATALGVMKILEGILHNIFNTSLSGKKVVIINRSHLIGLPLSQLVLHSNGYPVILHSKVPKEELIKEIKSSDIVVTGCGKRAIFNNEYFKDGQILIDCSMLKEEGVKGVGDIDQDSIITSGLNVIMASGYGHTGPATVLGLMDNVIKYYEM